MTIKLTAEAVRAVFPRAPQQVIDAFVEKQDVLARAGILDHQTRLSYFFANIEHECGGFTIPNLTENTNYSASRMAEVWPNRFSSASAVKAKYGSGKGWQLKAFDDIYGNRMGNRRGTSDGSRYIGRGGPQWTGRDGYAALERLTGLPAVDQPEIASQLDMQPEVCAAFWTWKNLSRYADAGDFIGCVKAWNGGTNGLADRRQLMASNASVLKRLADDETETEALNVQPAKKIASTRVEVLQRKLDRLGYHEVGTIDGLWGGKSAGASVAFMLDRGKTFSPPSDGSFNEQVFTQVSTEIDAAIADGWTRPIAASRALATPADIAPKVEAVRQSLWQRLAAKITGTGAAAGTVITGAASQFGAVNDTISPVKEFFASVPPIVWFGLVLIAAVLVYLSSNRSAEATTADYNTGRIN